MINASDLIKQANQFILDKLLNIFSFRKSTSTNEAYEKFKSTFETKEMSNEIELLFKYPKKALLIGAGKDNSCVVCQNKDSFRKIQRKAVLILKTSREQPMSEDMHANFLFIELSKNILDQMYVICKDIFYPMLAQSVYQGDTSELISKELMEKFHNFLAHFYVILGHIKKKILLPIPSDEVFRNPKINDNEKTQICEGAVVMWIELVKHILKQEPEYDFRNGANPDPMTEILFWEKKSMNLESILQQIQGEQVLEILKFLEKQKSSYHKFFNDIKKEVVQKSKEATQNFKFLSFLRSDLTEFISDRPLPELTEFFVPIFHTIRLIWKDNEYYSKPERLIVLIRKICNSLIEQATSFIGHGIFTKIIDPEQISEAISRLETTRDVVSKFMTAYFSYKDNDVDGWKITRNVIFYRLDAFNDRVGDILNIARSYNEFIKVSTKFIGGIRGETLQTMLLDIFNECTFAVRDFCKEDYHPLDIVSDVFNGKYSKYKETLKELEGRIAAVLTQTFDECDTIIGKFKILENFDSILERPNIVVELEKKYNILLELYKNELRTVQNLFQSGIELIKKNDPKNPLNKNMPPIAAILYWTNSLKERVDEPYFRFVAIDKRVTEKEEFREIENLYHSIKKMINEYEGTRKTNWDGVSKVNSGDKQKDYILVKKGELLQINFDPQLLQLLKEIKYLKILNLEIPSEAEEVFAKNNIFRKNIASLENITGQYNNIILSLNEVEKPIVQEKLKKVEAVLESSFKSITWERTKEIEDFVVKAFNAIGDMASIVDKFKNFVSKIETILREWREKRLFIRPSNKIFQANELNEYFIANFEQERSVMATRAKDFINFQDIQGALKSAVSNLSTFKESDKWKNYLHFINSIIINGLREVIQENLLFLFDCLDGNLEPFCSVRLILDNRKLIFEPELNVNEKTERMSIKGMLLGWINSFLNLSTVSRTRVDTGNSGDYMIEILENYSIQEIIYKLYNDVNELIIECDKVIESFKDYKVFWEKDFEVSFQEFLKQYVVIPEETLDQQERNERIKKIFGKDGNPITKGVVEHTPPKEIFDDKINELKNMLKRVKNMENDVKIRWVIVDFMQFKNELEKIIEKWINEYKNFLSKNSKNKIKNINEFMQRVRLGTSQIPKDTANKGEFIQLLENIRDMNNLYPKIVEIIPSIKGELEILKMHSRGDSEDDFLENEERELESEEHKLLLETENITKNIVKLNKDVEEVFQNINDLIEKESANFKIVVDDFRMKVDNFRDELIKNVPNKIDAFSEEEIQNAYKTLDFYFKELQKLEEEKKKNNNMELLLGLNVSQNKQISDSFNDLTLYKLMWDYISLIYYAFENWKKMKWEKVDATDLADRIDIFKAQLKAPLRKDIRSFDSYKSLLKIMTNMEDTISVIKTLKDKAIKTRHWKHLMENIGKILPYDSPDFSVDNLIKLEMYSFKSQCEFEKLTAADQERIEVQFNKIEKHWQNQEFKMTKNLNKKEYDFFIFDHGQMEVVIETLEKNQNTLIQQAQKKSTLENFEGMDQKINSTLLKLQTVNDVIKTWLKLQKNWEKLEPLFLRAEDVRNKLGEEYNKFKELDMKFKEEMKIAYDFNIMIDVCTDERKVTLVDLTKTIEHCEQALENYLDDKKKLFPRFYFLSNDTLLNMLSYGEYPNIINRNVKDCFDGIKSWAMTEVNDKNKSDVVLGMLSAENDEEVWFEEPYKCTGLVEGYLGRFEDKMRKTLKDLLYKSRSAVKWMTWGNHDKTQIVPRQKWLDPYPAQLALLVTQNIWTDEVEHAFEELDGGAEGAMKEYYEENVRRINKLIDRVKGETLTRDLRVKIITIITVDVHGRDVVFSFWDKKISDVNNFNWKKQLRFKYSLEKQDVSILIADYTTIYSYEYIGNTGRLVITPLTDRCYITLTQAMNLILGGAPAGPAGTGKTETTKDLGRNLGLGVIVNNCSEQMDIETTARIFSGLAQTGFWGCFDEFNRITIEVLSVVSTQVKTVLDAMKMGVTTFKFEGSEIRLVQTCGFFITMNPGYAGRTELPDNLKALFRSCAMVVPNLENICENMLMSEGFVEAKKIGRKFFTLYFLSKDLLSKQKHYDWGLRAIKSLLRQAGALKRHPLNQGKPEELIIMNALYDFNKAKIIPDDLVIFRRLLDDLFKENTSDGKGGKETEDVNQELNEKIEEATELIKLQKDGSFTVKARQLFEILEVRHCMFILGSPGSGKTSIWKTLFHTMKDCYKIESAYDKLSPKAITGNELFGFFGGNKSWRYGILSAIMKKMCKNDPPYRDSMKKKWIILDGDIDPDWIESLNTVMDDNKVLTLNNGDRFPLDEFMRLIFEISNLRNATLATVSRGGVLYVNDNDIGIAPFFEKWIKTRYMSTTDNPEPENDTIKSVVQKLFGETFNKIKTEFKDKYVAPMVEMNLVQNVCTIFQYLVEEARPFMKEADEEKKKLMVEGVYFFSFMWGAGGSLQDRKDMVNLVSHLMSKKISIPHTQGGTCFDYFFDPKTIQWLTWSSIMKDFQVGDRALFQDIIVPNVEVMRLSKITEINCLEEKPVLFIGDAGTGKTAIVKYYLKTLENLKTNSGFQYKYFPVNFNSFTDSFAFQNILESQLSIRFGIKFGPLGTTKLIYFLDDLNMPGLDKYGTQSHVELLRQLMDYKEIYDRKNLEEKKMLEDVLFVACQNPKAGSFKVDLRLQRHFTVLATTEPKQEIINEVYTFILKNHFKEFKFKSVDGKPEELNEKLVSEIISASCMLLDKIRKGDKCFTPSATKFHYQWNLREIAKIIEGVLRTKNTYYKEIEQVYRLWLHECNRIFRDRLIFPEDIKRYEEVSFQSFDQTFSKYTSASKKDDVAEPFIFVPFDENDMIEDGENVLLQKDFSILKDYMALKLEEYNDRVVSMPLVLFDDAIMHISRIARIISNPSSHALLIGVGGSGKQSLSKLAAFIKNTDVFSPNLTGTDYNREKLLEDFKNLVKNSCLKPSASSRVFMINDNHILEEYFIVYINNFLSSSWIEEMYENKTELDTDLQKIRSQAISEEFMRPTDSGSDKIFEYLLYRIKMNIHMILCMSPVGDKLRVRARKFPGILSCTNIDWFHEWPDVALEKVAATKISEMEQFQEENTLIKLSQITAELHKSIKSFNDLYFAQERRYNYTTPKSYLELISFFQLIVSRKDSEIEVQVDRLEKGLNILAEISVLIAKLKEDVQEKSQQVEIEKAKTNVILEELVVENEKISKEQEIVGAAAQEAALKSAQAATDEREAKEALDRAEPIKETARNEAKNIDPKALTELKKMGQPTEDGMGVFQLIYMIFFPKDKSHPTDLNIIKSKCMNQDSNIIKNKLIEKLEQIEWLDNEFLEKNTKFTKYPFTDAVRMGKVSAAAKNVAIFFQNCVEYKKQFDICKPLKEKSDTARAIAEESSKRKEELEAKFNIILAAKKQVEDRYEASREAKERVEAEQKSLLDKLDMAEKFIALLSGNKTRWTEEVRKLKDFKIRIAGDCLLASSFVSYIGIFNSFFREKLLDRWQQIIISKDVPITKNVDVVRILITDSQILKFKAEGLPADPFSTENSAIISSCTRWPLIIDPQMQAIKWLKGMNGKKTCIQYKQKDWDIIMGNSISNGEILIIEDVDQEFDPLLTPILAKETTKKDSRQFIKIGSEEYEFNLNAKVFFITKISNPHYKPEIIAQCTLINFIVTEKGLEDQLLASVVNIEQPELEETIKKCIDEINEFQAELILKEDDVLRNLKEADPKTILENIALLNSLEATKARALEIEEKSKISEDLVKEINIKREQYRKVGIEGAMLFFLISKLFVVQFMYQYSLESFNYFFVKAINNTETNPNLSQRINNLTENIRLTIYLWVSSGMFEKDKQLFLTMISLRLLQKKAITHEDVQGITKHHIDFLLKCPRKMDAPPKENSLNWMDDGMWMSLNYLSDLDGFQEFASKMEKEQSTKFREWFNEVSPEENQFPLPLEWRKYKKHSFHKILVLRCCRPDRVSVALNEFVKNCLPRGREFLEPRTFSDLVRQSYFDSNPEVPIFFILSPGSNPIKELQDLGRNLGKKKFEYGKNFFDVAMGQKADEKAEALLNSCNQDGHWLFLQNIHLMPRWLKKLQDIMKELAKEKGNDEFRIFLSAEPRNEIPVGILEKGIKLTNEPPSGLKENMKIAFETLKRENPNFTDDKRRANVMFALSYFHSVVLERKKFASLGWNRNYPFNLDDLRSSDSVIAKYLEQNPGKVPWDDLRYIVGEIMYGGHIVDDWDRRLSNAYLEYLLTDKINEDLDLIPYSTNKILTLKTPANSTFAPEKWADYMDLTIQTESPALFGLHPNAELDYRIMQSDLLFSNLIDLEPKDSSGASGGDESEGNRFEKIKMKCDDITSKSNDGLFNIEAIKAALTHDKTPYQNVFIQECEQMRNLCELIKRNTTDVKAAIDGQLTMNEMIEALIDNIHAERVPPKWIDEGFSTNRKLASWLMSLEARISQYKIFEPEQLIPKIVFINRLFNPLSYLTAIRQVHARKIDAELDKLDIHTIPTKIDLRVDQEYKEKESTFEVPIYGLHLQGARWDDDTNSIEESRPREDYCVMPVIKCRVIDVEQLKNTEKGFYQCPMYKTTKRDATYVTTAQFRSKLNPAKWIIAGVAVILDVEKTDSITKYPK